MQSQPVMDNGVGVGVVGLESQIKRIQEILQTNQRLGIVGMDGIGKTTLAKAVFNLISKEFDYYCFLYNVKHSVTSNKYSSNVREKISENLYHQGRKVINHSWKKKKAVIVLDGANSECQADLTTETDGFSNESRVIVTSRDKGFLIPLDFEFYMARELNLEDSKQLFCLHAFKTRVAPRSYEEQVVKFAKKCGGLPLALKVSGRYLFSQKEDAWDNAFRQLGT
jgi:hypothetical protein